MATVPAGGGLVPQTTSLGDMINMARGIQQYQQAQQINPLAVEKAQLELSRLQQLTPEEVARAQAEAKVATQTVAPRISTAESQAQTAGTQAASTAQDFALKTTNAIAGRLTSLINNPLLIAAEQNPQGVNKDALTNLFQTYGNEQASALGIPKDQASKLIQPYIDQALTNPASVRQFLKEKLLTTLDQASRVGALQPSGVPISTGAGGAVIQTGQFGPYQPGEPLPGTTYIQQVRPETEIVDPRTGERRLVGPQAAPPQQPLVTGLPPGQAKVLEGAAATIGQDVQTTINEARDAPQRISIFQNIKKLSPEAFTGVGGARKELAAGILNAIGIPAYEQAKVSTEELRKNSALLALAGGNTDAARALAELAVPNTKLNEKAVRDIADQLIGVENMKVARAKFLTPVLNDAVAYQQRQLQFNQIADSRLFEEATPEKVKKIFKAMSKRDQQDMLDKIETARRMGILP